MTCWTAGPSWPSRRGQGRPTRWAGRDPPPDPTNPGDIAPELRPRPQPPARAGVTLQALKEVLAQLQRLSDTNTHAQCCTSWTVQTVVKGSTTCLKARVDLRDLTVQFASCFSADTSRPLCKDCRSILRQGPVHSSLCPGAAAPAPGLLVTLSLSFSPQSSGLCLQEGAAHWHRPHPAAPQMLFLNQDRGFHHPQVLQDGTETQTQPRVLFIPLDPPQGEGLGSWRFPEDRIGSRRCLETLGSWCFSFSSPKVFPGHSGPHTVLSCPFGGISFGPLPCTSWPGGGQALGGRPWLEVGLQA